MDYIGYIQSHRLLECSIVELRQRSNSTEKSIPSVIRGVIFDGQLKVTGMSQQDSQTKASILTGFFVNKNHIILPVRFLVWICFIGPYNCGMYKHYSRRSLLRSLAEPL